MRAIVRDTYGSPDVLELPHHVHLRSRITYPLSIENVHSINEQL